MQITITYKGILSGVKGVWCGFYPKGAEITEEITVYRADEGKVLVKGEEMETAVILDEGESIDEWEEIDEPVEEETDDYEQQEQELFAKEFFNTSLGYVRRKVKMKNGAIKDFLTDILSLLQIGTPIITYNIDKTQNTGVLVTEQFIQECKQQLFLDFYGANGEN